MVDLAKVRARALSLVVALPLGGVVLGGACGGSSFQSLVLNDTCAAATSACVTEGDVTRTTGLTADTIGFRLDDGALRVSLPLMARTAFFDPSFFELEALAARAPGSSRGVLKGRVDLGTCPEGEICEAPSATSTNVGDDYAWITVASSFDGNNTQFSFSGDAVLELEGAGVDVIELRAESFGGSGCSVATRGSSGAWLGVQPVAPRIHEGGEGAGG